MMRAQHRYFVVGSTLDLEWFAQWANGDFGVVLPASMLETLISQGG